MLYLESGMVANQRIFRLRTHLVRAVMFVCKGAIAYNTCSRDCTFLLHTYNLIRWSCAFYEKMYVWFADKTTAHKCENFT